MASSVMTRQKPSATRKAASNIAEPLRPVPKLGAVARKIPLLDLTRKYKTIATEVGQEWNNVFASMRLLNGSNLAAFEKEFAEFCGVRHALGVASGTDAIFLSLQALGIGRGDEVILAAHVPAPVIEPVLAVGATPVLIDKAVGDYGPDLAGLRAAITGKTKAILAVHMLGLPCDMSALAELADRSGIAIIEDSSQAQGARYRNQRAAGLGRITPMSLGPVKNLACYGDGGVVLTNDDALAEQIKLLRVHGQAEKYDHRIHGWNSRLDEMQAAVLRKKLPTLDQDNDRRGTIAAQYSAAFRNLPLTTPPQFDDRVNVYHQYVMETKERDRLKAFLEAKGIGTGIYYPLPLHQHAAWKSRQLAAYQLPESERYSRENLAIPVFAELEDVEVEYIIAAVCEYFSSRE